MCQVLFLLCSGFEVSVVGSSGTSCHTLFFYVSSFGSFLSYPTNHLLWEILSHLLNFQSSSENCNGFPEYFQESQSLGKKNRTSKHVCLLLNGCLLIFPFLGPNPGICFSFWLFLLRVSEVLSISGSSESDSHRMVVVRALSRAQTVPKMFQKGARLGEAKSS